VTRVVAIILHAAPSAGAGPLEAWFADARAANAARLARGFEAAGAEARIVETQRDGPTFGARLRDLAAADPAAGIVILGSGSVPLATRADLRTFVAAAAVPAGPVLANNRYSADVIALPSIVDLAGIPNLAADNGLPRWLADHGVEVRDLRGRWRLGVDLDSPLDVLITRRAADAAARIVDRGADPRAEFLVAGRAVAGRAARARATFEDPLLRRAADAAARIADRTADPRAELLVAGRTSAATLGWLERHTPSRTRALIEERGMRTAHPDQRPARSTLGFLLDREGPGALGGIIAELADAAVIDSRVLLAHRLGPDEAGWPPAEDRFASDLLLHERIGDPWLRALTEAAATAAIPVLLGGHTLVGPGLRLLLSELA